jgi:hypothetical protein
VGVLEWVWACPAASLFQQHSHGQQVQQQQDRLLCIGDDPTAMDCFLPVWYGWDFHHFLHGMVQAAPCKAEAAGYSQARQQQHHWRRSSSLRGAHLPTQ